ncbi:MAG: D-Ala-D-Ala carboxypeptidase family metallohydrolase [Candidatus Eisenbacteria bacterium]
MNRLISGIAGTRVTGGLLIAVLAILLAGPEVSPSHAFAPERAGFQVKVKDVTSPYRVIGVFVLPGETLPVEALPLADSGEYEFIASAGETVRLAPNKWQWVAPGKTGSYHLVLGRSSTSDTVTLNVFVMVPYENLKGEYLNGYRIGRYPTIPLKDLPIYKPPRGFIEVTPANEETLVGSHFRLKQFICKQDSDYPKYLVLNEKLLLKLELVLEKVNEMGYPASTFEVMSGYRTPYYNKMIGNVKYSRHVWGGAADIFIDEEPRDCIMDDLNKDGKHDYRDAAILYDIVDEMYGKPWYQLFVGGLGRYKKTGFHGPFVHVDVRGFRSRWGD